VVWGHAGLHWGWRGVVGVAWVLGVRLVGCSLPLLCRAARGGPAGAHGVYPAGACALGTGLLVLLPERWGVLPVRPAVSGGVDDGRAAASPTGPIDVKSPEAKLDLRGTAPFVDRRSRGGTDRALQRKTGPAPPIHRQESLSLPRIDTLICPPALGPPRMPRTSIVLTPAHEQNEPRS